MSLTRYVRMPIAAACLAVLASCGAGGDDEAGSETPFSITPTDYGKDFGNDPCTAATDVAQIYVLGGTAPYKVRSTTPRVTVDRSTVEKGGSFKISLAGGCLDPGLVVVEDDRGRSATLTVKVTGS